MVAVVLSVCTVVRTRVANSPCRRNVLKCNASAVADPITFYPEFVAMMDCVFEWLCIVLYRTCTTTPVVLFRVVAQPAQSASVNTCILNSMSSGDIL